MVEIETFNKLVDQAGELTSQLVQLLPEQADPRGRKYGQSTIIELTLLGMFLGGNDLVNIAESLEEYSEEIKKIYKINRIPSHDTLGKRLKELPGSLLCEAFSTLTQELIETEQGDHIVIDGKVLRGSGLVSQGEHNPVIVNTIDVKTKLCTGIGYVDRKESEMTIAPDVLGVINLLGKIVNGDAAMSTPMIRKEIEEGKGYYVLPAKKNRGKLSEEIDSVFKEIDEIKWTEENINYFCPAGTKVAKFYSEDDYYCLETMEKGHGREEYRKYELLTDLSQCDLNGNDDVKAAGLVTRWTKRATTTKKQRKKHGAFKESRTVTPYILDFTTDIDEFVRIVRNEWGVENGLHYALDMWLNEDRSTIRNPQLRLVMAVLRRLVYNTIVYLNSVYKKTFLKLRNHIGHNFHLALRLVLGIKPNRWRVEIAKMSAREEIKKIVRNLGLAPENIPTITKNLREECTPTKPVCQIQLNNNNLTKSKL